MSVEREMSLVEWCTKLPMHHAVNRELITLHKQLAVLAEQNEKMREALEAANGNLITWVNNYTDSPLHDFITEAIDLPDLTSPVLNRIRAEGMRMASTFISLVRNDWASAGDNLSVQAAEYLISALDTRADELEKTNG